MRIDIEQVVRSSSGGLGVGVDQPVEHREVELDIVDGVGTVFRHRPAQPRGVPTCS